MSCTEFLKYPLKSCISYHRKPSKQKPGRPILICFLKRHFYSGSIVLLCLARPAFSSGFESLAGLGAISKPAGAAAWFDAGFSKVCWGNESDEFRYGFVRPTLKLQSSALVNSYEVQAGFYPISFFGLGVGNSASLRQMDFSEFDCNKSYCRGGLNRTFVRSSLVLAVNWIFGGTEARWDLLTPSRKQEAFADEVSTLRGAPRSDQLLNIRSYLGIKFSEAHYAGFLFEMSKMKTTRDRGVTEALFYRLAKGAWELNSGAGIYHSSLLKLGPTVFLTLERKFTDRLGFE